MWRVALQRSVREVRFVIRDGPAHHGTWFFVNNHLEELRILNPNTFFSVASMNDNFKQTQSSCLFRFGDLKDTELEVKTDNKSPDDWAKEFEKAVNIGKTLPRQQYDSNFDRDLPMPIVEARKYVKYMDDGF